MSAENVLFDAAGPKARRRHTLLAVLVGIASLGVLAWVLTKLGEKGNLTAEKWTPFLRADTWTEYLIQGIGGTLTAAAISIAFAGILGLLMGMGRLSHNTPLRWFSSVFVEFFRAVPVLMMMIFSFALYSLYEVFPPERLALAGVVTGLTFYNAAVMAELLRAGVGSLPSGQREAGLSIGLTPVQTLRTILLPQALTAMLPAIVGQLVVILKDSALGSQITYVELLLQGQTLGTARANTIPAFIVTAVIFITMNYLLTVLASRLERRMRQRGHTSGTIPTVRGQAESAALQLQGPAAVRLATRGNEKATRKATKVLPGER
jgi:glutamate transport system permease protein